MDQLPSRIELFNVADNTPVGAVIARLTRPLAKEKIDGVWWKGLEAPRDKREREDDHHWQWAKMVGFLKNDRWHEAVAAQTSDNDVQGAILYWINTKSFLEAGRGAVYVQALATAPRNRPWLVPSPRYRGVGEKLLFRAVTHSYSLGLEGRVNLEAFNNERTTSFYQNRGFTLVESENDDDLAKLELAPNAAVAWLREGGYDV